MRPKADDIARSRIQRHMDAFPIAVPIKGWRHAMDAFPFAVSIKRWRLAMDAVPFAVSMIKGGGSPWMHSRLRCPLKGR